MPRPLRVPSWWTCRAGRGPGWSWTASCGGGAGSRRTRPRRRTCWSCAVIPERTWRGPSTRPGRTFPGPGRGRGCRPMRRCRRSAGRWIARWPSSPISGHSATRRWRGRRRAAAHLDSLARFLGVAGWRDQAGRARVLRDAVLAGGDAGGFDRFARRTARSRALRWMTRKVGEIDPATVTRYGLTGPVARRPGDAAARGGTRPPRRARRARHARASHGGDARASHDGCSGRVGDGGSGA